MMQLSPAEFEALRRIQTLHPADERLVYRSRHVGGLIRYRELRTIFARWPTSSKLRWAIDALQGDLWRSGTYSPGGFETRPDCQPKGSRCVGRSHPSCPQ